MKRVIIILLGAILLVGCVQNEDGEPVKGENYEKQQEKKTDKKVEQKKKDGAAKEKSEQKVKENTIKLDDELLFGEFTINMKSVKLYEEDGKNLAEVKYTWTNQAGDGKKYFFALTSNDVFQGDELLTETTGAALMENKKTNSFHEHNGEGGTVNIRLVYELVGKDAPLTLRFKPLNEFSEDAQEVIIDIK